MERVKLASVDSGLLVEVEKYIFWLFAFIQTKYARSMQKRQGCSLGKLILICKQFDFALQLSLATRLVCATFSLPD